MNTKNIIIGIAAVAIVGLGVYFAVNKYRENGTSPATSGAATQQTTTGTSTPAQQVQGQEVKVGTGAEAKPGMVVTVEYVGKLTDGTVFDSSESHKQPLVFTLGSQGIIPGFQIGVNTMKVGGERLLAIPPALAYGDQKFGIIPPNSTLIFDVKLTKVEAAPAKPVTAPAPTKK